VRDRFSIIGFTEAELGFIVAILLLAAMLSHRTAVVKPTSKPTPAVSLKEFESLKQQVSQLTISNKALKHALDQQSNLRSRLKPPCVERHIAKGFIGDIRVTGIDQFQLEGKTFNMDDLLDRFSTELKQAQEAGCVQSIRITPSPNISPGDYVRARNALGQHFYPADRTAN
jgi:hypothetical protein